MVAYLRLSGYGDAMNPSAVINNIVSNVPAVEQAVAAPSNVPIIAACITAGAAVVAAIGAGIYAHRNWRTAQDKVFIDLFDRRLKAYTAISTALKQFIDVIEKTTPATLIVGVNGPTTFSALYDSYSQIHFLFGPDITAKMQAIDTAAVASFHARKNMVKEGYQYMEDWSKKHAKLLTLQRELPDAFAPYMSMAEMGVKRTEARKRFFFF